MVGKTIRILTTLTASSDVQEDFLNNWRNGTPKLPELKTQVPTYSQEIEALSNIIFKCDRSDPIGNYVAETAESYLAAVNLISTAGTSDFLHFTFQLYGHPQDPFPNQSISIRQAADKFLDVIEPYMLAAQHTSPEQLMTSFEFAEIIQKVADRKFPDHKVEIVIDPNLSSRAAAGATRVRIREQSMFTRHDIGQLVNHELFVHTLTSINGRNQPHFPSLGTGSPRTVQTQEGIAVFAEIATNTMDTMRLRRIALRVIAINMAIEGANFLEVFQFFINSGYDEAESSHSTFRVFRGGDPNGSICFTKDIVYLGGLITLQEFLQSTVKEAKHENVELLFAGRLTIADTLNLVEAYKSGAILPPISLPDWADDFSTLAPSFILRLPFINSNTD